MLAQINSLRFFSQLNSTSALLNLSGFKNSCDDMGPRPVGKTLDQKNPQGHYEPTNCRWADAETQTQNRRCVLYPDSDVPKLEGACSGSGFRNLS